MPEERPHESPDVWIVSAGAQNVFFAELLDALADALGAAGLSVARSVDRFPGWNPGDIYLFVPHEYMPLVRDQAHPSPAHLARTIVLSTEQPGTQWFEQAVGVAANAAATVDINPLGVLELRRRGVAAELMQLGYVPSWDTWGGRDAQERPIDVTFMGGYTRRRARALARCGRLTARRRSELVLTETLTPHREGSADFLAGEHRWAVLRSSKLILNIHRAELGYLEWLRVVGAIANGCVVLTEHSLGFEPLLPGLHFASAGYERLPVALDALLEDPLRLTAMRRDAYDFLRQEMPLSGTIAPLVRKIEHLKTLAADRSRLAVGPTPRLPLAPCLPPTEYERISSHRSDLDRVRIGVKQLVVDQAQRRREARRAELAGESQASSDRIEHRGVRDRAVRVSVVLTVYNYANLVGLAIASVARSDLVEYELVVVDDCSTDGSAAAIRGELAKHPQVATTIVSRGLNEGLAAARNMGARLARGEYLFILDADNEIYPHALRRLCEALDETPDAGFAYGIIEQFDPDGPCDLMSWHAWDRERFKYGNYIDAMAMVRRSVLLDAGGYTNDARLGGWEDFALWCALAERGIRGVRLPEILARYRTGVFSMIDITDIDATAAWAALVEQSPFLARGNRVPSGL